MSTDVAIKLSRFCPWQIALIAVSVMLIAIGGCLFVLTSFGWISIFGIVITGLGAWMISPPNWRKISEANPVKGGALYVWGRPLHDKNGKQYVVGGHTITANYFPFFLDITEVTLNNSSHGFDITVYPLMILNGSRTQRKTRVQVEGKIVVVGIPNTKDIEDYVQAGGSMVAVFDQLKGIANNVAERIAAESLGFETVAQLGNALGEAVLGRLSTEKFGVIFTEVNATMTTPKDIVTAMTDVAVEQFQRESEIADLETVRDLAQILYTELNLGHNPPKYTMDRCVEMVITNRAIQAGKGSVVNITGSGSGPVVPIVTPSKTT